jgi:tripartite-type tricarboxylate transporter receptor subunit TctC
MTSRMRSTVFAVRALPVVLSAAALVVPDTHATAQSWPAKSVRLIVGYAPGGVGDVTARIYGTRLSQAWGQSVLIDNRPGANGGIGAELVAHAPADGYTLLMSTASELVINPSVYPKLGYDTLKDFAPIALASRNPVVLVANAASPFRTLADLVTAAKGRPDTLSYGTPGIGSIQHLSMEMLRMLGGPSLIHVAYKGGGPAAAAVVTGETPLGAVALAPALAHMQAGRIRALGLSSLKRSPLAPDAPTFAEGGFPIDASIWTGVLAPARTLSAVIGAINVEMVRASQTADVRDRLATAGSEVATSTPAEFSALLKSELARYERIVRSARVKVE